MKLKGLLCTCKSFTLGASCHEIVENLIHISTPDYLVLLGGKRTIYHSVMNAGLHRIALQGMLDLIDVCFSG